MAFELLRMPGEWSDRAVRRALDDEQPLMRLWAAFSCHRAHPKSTEGLDALRRFLASRKPTEQLHSGKALGGLGKDVRSLLSHLGLAIHREYGWWQYDQNLNPFVEQDALRVAWRHVRRAVGGSAVPADKPMFYWMDCSIHGR
jgi:hypothetical protein